MPDPLITINPADQQQVGRLAQHLRRAIVKQRGYLYNADLSHALRCLNQPDDEPTVATAPTAPPPVCLTTDGGSGQVWGISDLPHVHLNGRCIKNRHGTLCPPPPAPAVDDDADGGFSDLLGDLLDAMRTHDNNAELNYLHQGGRINIGWGWSWLDWEFGIAIYPDPADHPGIWAYLGPLTIGAFRD